ncbi:MAG: type II secretion system protein [Candidatus Brennerbacteria bacterium]|nr:type II secretion system protein [Candidatus Brennerbacteria bacterium]
MKKLKLFKNLYEYLLFFAAEVFKIIEGLINPLNSKSYILNSRNGGGFTLIELVISISILVILAAVGGINLLNYRLRRGLESDAQKISSALREVRNRSVTQLDGNQWGVHFENPTGTADFYQTFYGASYASGTASGNKITLSNGIIFLDPVSNGFKDIIFLKVSGLPVFGISSALVIGLISGSASTTINIDAQGKVSY